MPERITITFTRAELDAVREAMFNLRDDIDDVHDPKDGVARAFRRALNKMREAGNYRV